MRTVAIIQARTASTRLPGKVLMDIAGHTMLWWVVQAAKDAGLPFAIAAPRDDPRVCNLCLAQGWTYHGGHPTDLIDRLYRAASALGAETIVRLTGDCPLLSADHILHAVAMYRRKQCDYYTNRPAERDGYDVEVFTFGALERAWRECTDSYQREHAGLAILSLDRLPIATKPGPIARGKYSVDTEEDLNRVRSIMAARMARV